MPSNTIPTQEVLTDDLIDQLRQKNQKEQNQGLFPPSGSKAGQPTPETEGVFPPSGAKSGFRPE